MWRCWGNFSTFLKILLRIDVCYLHTQTHTLCVKSSHFSVACSEGARFGSKNTNDLWHDTKHHNFRVNAKYLKCWHSSCFLIGSKDLACAESWSLCFYLSISDSYRSCKEPQLFGSFELAAVGQIFSHWRHKNTCFSYLLSKSSWSLDPWWWC